jgi:PilZ domain
MKDIEERRHHTGFRVRWPVTYCNDELFGQGTILDVSHRGCEIAGTMSVAVGMRLKLWISPPREEHLCIEQAQVLWVKDHEFGLRFRHLTAGSLASLADG